MNGKVRRCAWALLLAMAVFAQAELADPLPVWREDGRISKYLSDHYVFVTKDGSALVLLVPEDPNAGLGNRKRIVRMALWNDLAPSVSVSVARLASGEFRYQYGVRNGVEAKDSIGTWTLIVAAGVYPLELVSPQSGSMRLNVRNPGAPARARHPLFPDLPAGRYLNVWHYRDVKGIGPGEVLRGFELYSPYEPGLTTALFASGKAPEVDPNWPPKVLGEALPQYWNRIFRFVLTVGPMFPPETPAQERVARLRGQIEALLKSGHLSASSEFVKEALSALRQFPNFAAPPVVKTRPANETESAVGAALQFIPVSHACPARKTRCGERNRTDLGDCLPLLPDPISPGPRD